MADYILWLIAGIALIIAELVTGTFYLLVLGGAAIAGAAVAWAGLSFWPQTIAAAVVSAAGVMWVHHWRKARPAAQMPSLDVGQPAKFESWVSESARHARVRYRDSTWDAQVMDLGAASPGDTFYIVALEGSTLKLSRTRPA